MKGPAYIIITRSDGKQKLYRTERYLLMKRLTFIGAIVAALVVMLLFCGMAIAEDGPIMPLQVMMFICFGLFMLGAFICSYVSFKEPYEKQKKNIRRRK